MSRALLYDAVDAVLCCIALILHHCLDMSSSSPASSRSSLQRRSAIATSPSNSLDALLPRLLSSKRSLSTVEHVYRANDICTFTRTALENCAITSARSCFLRSGITSQLNVLQNVHNQTSKTALAARAEFDDVVRGLDEAEKRLRDTLKGLKETMVEVQLRPEGEERRCLLDFVDEGGVEGLIMSLRSNSKDVGRDFEAFNKGNRYFGDDLVRIEGILEQKGRVNDSWSQDMRDAEGSPIPEILADMEEHAKEMALNLESLVSHFDLCVTAIKHTEGGGDAALKIAGDLPDGVETGHNAKEAPPEPLDDDQMAEMMRVLEEDAGQVEEVVMEIKSHIFDMERMYQRVEAHMEHKAKEQESVTTAFKLLEGVGQGLAGHITRSQAFHIRWDNERARIFERLEELDNAKGFYDGFLKAYDNLIIEIGRRKSIEGKINKVIQDATSKLEKLYEDDMDERDAFRKEQGEFLPIDIWPGLLNSPTRFNVKPVDGMIDRVPDISKSVIHRAIRRVHGQS